MAFPFTFPAPRILDPAQLRAEIEAATGLEITAAGREGPNLWVTFATTETVDDIELWDTLRDLAVAHTPNDLAGLDAILTKAEAVAAGTDTFTPAQLQRIVARLALIVARHLR